MSNKNKTYERIKSKTANRNQLSLELEAICETEFSVDFFNQKRPESVLTNNINECRSKISHLFYRNDKPKPAFTSCSDGTGTGKSFAQLNAYLDETDINNIAEGHRCLFFITPLKNQIDFPKFLLKKALEKNIYFIPFLSRQDLFTMSFTNWLPDINNKIETNKDRYNRWINNRKLKKQSKEISDALMALQDSIKMLAILELKIKDRSSTENMRSAHEEDLMNEQNRLTENLKDLAMSCLEINHKDFKSLFTSTCDIDRLIAEIVLHSFPLEMAKFLPCVLVSTTRKFDFKANILSKKKDGKYANKSQSFTRLLGCKKNIKITEFGAYVAQPHEEQIKYLTETYLAQDETNIFSLKNISFDLVIDEEHDAYGALSQSSITNLLDNKKTQLPDVLAGIHRILCQVEGYKENPISPVACLREKEELLQTIYKALNDHCDISEGHNLRTLTKLFLNKVDHFLIRSTNVEQIINLTKNVFSFRPKRFFNENSLRKIRIKTMYFDSTYEIYFTDDENDSNASLYDIYQVLLACLYGASCISKGSKLIQQLRDPSAHNETLARFITKAGKVSGEVAQMFDKTTDSDLEINHFFTFFLPKAVFSIEKCKEINYFNLDDGTEDVTYVDFRLDIITELPEAELVQFLYNTNNTVLTLSATSGISGVCNGQYDRSFLEKYSSSGIKKPDLGYAIIGRDCDDIPLLKNLRDSRNKLKDVKFHIFSEKLGRFPSENSSEKFEDVYKRWYKILNNHSYEGYDRRSRNEYKEKEFTRSLRSMLLAAYDKKNSLILSLSKDFIRTLRAYLKTSDTSIFGFKIPPSNEVENCSIFEFKPFDNGVTLRVILFDSDLGQSIDVREYMRIDNSNIKIAFISYYKAAGTGLNYFINYSNELEEDFERLVLVNSPYWSQVHKNGGWNTLENYVTLLKHHANSKGVKFLSDFSSNLLTGENYKILQFEHQMELIKVVMQALGRIERRDTNLMTEIFMPEDIHNNAVLQFQKLKQDPKNELFLESMSLLNYKWMEECQNTAIATSYRNSNERITLEKNSIKNAKILTSFFNKTVLKILEDARNGDKSAIQFNEALRSITCVTDPIKYIDILKSTEFIKNDRYLLRILDAFYIDIGVQNKHVKLCRKDNDPDILTDTLYGDYGYNPTDQLLRFIIEKDSNPLANKVIRTAKKLEKNAFQGLIPHPIILPLLKGNIGEYLVKILLNELDIAYFNSKEIVDHIGYRAYELFDFYLCIGDDLICIDAKNWTTSADKKDMSLHTHEKALGKLMTIKEYVGNKYESIKCVYINTRKDQNDMNYIFSEVSDGGKIFYLNMFKEVTGYHLYKKSRITPKGKDIVEDIGRLSNTVVINEKLIQLLDAKES